MVRFAPPNPEEASPKPAMDEVHALNNPSLIPSSISPSLPIVTSTTTTSSVAATVTPPVMGISTGVGYNNINQQNPAVGLAEAAIEDKVVDDAIEKQHEHWAKAYWRPAMGWLYMAMCAFDFIIFPMITLFLPVIENASGIHMPYNEWKSLTLSNGGMIHIAFGAILGVAAWTRGQEKLVGRQ